MSKEACKLTLSNIGLSYGDTVVCKQFDAVFEQGLNVVLGKSGCGKTSLLNIIAGLVRFEGECSSPKPAMVFSEPALAPVTVEGNVKAVLGRRSDKQVEQALKLAKIYDKRKQNALTLSDGEKQRVSLARAFAVERQVMLLDEPFSRLDYGVKKQLYATLIEYMQNREITAVLVTHDIDEALTLADRIYLLDGAPCRLRSVAEITRPVLERDIYGNASNAIRKQLQELLG